MDNISEFFAKAIPWDGSGNCTVHYQLTRTKDNDPPFLGRSFNTLAAFLAGIESIKHAQPHYNIWFGLARQKPSWKSGERSRHSVQSIKTLFTDIDLAAGHPRKYATVREALIALLGLCKRENLPLPSAIVFSGHGLHVYWFSNRSLTVAEWQPYADGLKTLFRNHKFKADLGIMGDVARVLRVPGTVNWKFEDRPVMAQLLPAGGSGELHDFQTVFAKLPDTVLAGPLGEPSKGFKSKSKGALAQGIEYDKTPLPLEPILAGCAWLRHVHETGGRDECEPLWHDALRACVYLENGEELAHKLSENHAGYDRAKTDEKLARAQADSLAKNLGWPSCERIQDDGSPFCDTCPHRNLDKSPLNLARPQHKPKSEPDLEPEPMAQGANDEDVPDNVKALGGSRPGEMLLPQNFCIDAQGRICFLTHEGKSANKIERLQPIWSSAIRKPIYHYDGVGNYGLSIEANTEKDVWRRIYISAKDLASKRAREIWSGLGLRMCSGKGMPTIMGNYSISWIDRLSQHSKASYDSGNLGWHKNESGKTAGFIYGGINWRINAEPVPALSHGDDEFHRWYRPMGSKEPWLNAVKLLAARQRPELDVLMAVGFAAPLMTFAGNVYGSILSVWGEPGTSKSCAQQIAASVWGHPKQTRESLTSTSKSVLNRMGRVKNLAAYWDDIQGERGQDHLFSTMFVASGGVEGGRLNTDTSQKQRLEWHTLVAACSNQSFIEYLIKTQRSTTAGMRRVLEFKFDKRPDEPGMIAPVEASRAFAELESNYGVVGQEYIERITRQYAVTEKIVVDTIQEFSKRVGATADETFWSTICGVLIAGTMLARPIGFKLNYKRMTDFLADVFEKNRRARRGEGTEGSSEAHTEHALQSYLNAYSTIQALYTKHPFQGRHIAVEVIHDPSASQRPVMFQVVVAARKIIVPKNSLREHLTGKEIAVRQVFDGIKSYYHGEELKMTLGAGTNYARVQETCFIIPVPHGNEKLEDILMAFGDGSRKPLLLKAVK